MRLYLHFDSQKTDQLMRARILGKRLKSDLVDPNTLPYKGLYKRFSNQDKKEAFRGHLIDALKANWAVMHGEEEASRLIVQFKMLAGQLMELGAVTFGSMVDKAHFTLLIKEYEKILTTVGSKTWIHAYVNLGNHPDFLNNPEFNEAFIHPLMVALISYNIGGAIRLVDARGKDAEPLSILAQDNMLHIDNTPFNEEYKMILTWEKGQPSGPKGQNFVILPGTNKGVRTSEVRTVDGQSTVVSTENASIFITGEAVERVFAFQGKALGSEQPQVVEVHDDDHPLSTIFQAGALVHHRYRTAEGHSRSCMILAFHRALDNPGQFIATNHLEGIKNINPLNVFLLGAQFASEVHDNKFIEALVGNAENMALKILEINSQDGSKTVVIPYGSRTMAAEELDHWRKTATAAPTVENYKQADVKFDPNREFSEKEMLDYVTDVLMPYDKHGPLDLILYSDSHEEIRKWARNRIREMNLSDLKSRMNTTWRDSLKEPSEVGLMSPAELKKICDQMAGYIGKIDISEKKQGKLNAVDKISPEDAYRSLQQLFIDLGETVVRCDCRQAFLSTSLFIFWACDELMRLRSDTYKNEPIKKIAEQLLNNYLSTFVLCEQHLFQSQEIKPAEVVGNGASSKSSPN